MKAICASVLLGTHTNLLLIRFRKTISRSLGDNTGSKCGSVARLSYLYHMRSALQRYIIRRDAVYRQSRAALESYIQLRIP